MSLLQAAYMGVLFFYSFSHAVFSIEHLVQLHLNFGRYVTLPTKVRLVKTMVFPVVMYGCESWTIKKVEH